MRSFGFFTGFLMLAACASGSNNAPADASRDAVVADAALDAPIAPADAAVDASTLADASSATDATSTTDAATTADAARDASAAADAAMLDDAGRRVCSRDSDCASGSEWCESGLCVECDNSGLSCRILCREGWSTYVRNGCHPCACAPRNECQNDGDCDEVEGRQQKCYAGAACPSWCPPGDPTCCFGGNHCSADSCSGSYPAGCYSAGCGPGLVCEAGCGGGSSCSCIEGSWACTRDCAGECVVPGGT